MRNETVEKIRKFRLPAFAEAYKRQIENEIEYQSMSFHERLALMVDAEHDSRHNNNIARLIKDARFPNSSAFLRSIEYLPDRRLNRGLLESLADNEYVRQGLNVALIGATGSGKTYIASALGVNACQHGYKTRYYRLPELLGEFEAARVQGQYPQLMKQLRKCPLLVLDEFLLVPATNSEQRDLLELAESRCGRSSTIICSQIMPEGWHERLGGGALADSILDRVIPAAYVMKIEGDVSMRRRKQALTQQA
jgi:DNA replication protein DnaC